ncbi:MAG: hypothetical protein KAY37_15150 [Phycisphaerae bacterium]|nr:hypothetical protein [Phycisphaerae bacterium]
MPNHDQHLLIEARTNGQPRPARDAVNEILVWLRDRPGAYGVFMAPYISPRAAEICSSQNIGYIDLSGNCRLSFGHVYICQEGRPNRFARKRDLRSLYAAKASRVLRVLLHDPRRRWKLVSLAKEARISLGQASNVKKLLADREWIRTDKDGIVLEAPEELLAEWAENYNYRRNIVHDYYSLYSVGDIERELAQTCRAAGVTYAFTGFSAAERLAPATRYTRVTAFVDGDIGDIARRMKFREVPSGANVSLLTPYDGGVFHGAQEIGGAMVAAPVQTYLDLRGYHVRGQEAADVLLREVIRPKW